jgi:predicted SnoaL-like aldol condensation-catalyzing enzyme
MRNVIVRYQLKPTRREEHVGLLRDVFRALHAARPEGLRYSASVAQDGLSFLHIARIDAPQGNNPLDEVPAFSAFAKDIKSRCDVPPAVTDVTVVGEYAAPSAREAKHQAAVRQAAEEVFTQGRVELLDEILHPEYQDHSAPEGLRDRAGFARIVETWRGGASQFRVEVVRIFGSGDWVGMVDVTSGVHDRGPIFGIPPSGKPFRFGAVHAFRFEEGRMREHWVETGMPFAFPAIVSGG